MVTAASMSRQELEKLVSSLESSIDQLSPPPPQGVVASINGHVRRYLPFYALLTAWVLIMALIPLVDRGDSAPAAAQTGAPAGDASGAGQPAGLPSGPPGSGGQRAAASAPGGTEVGSIAEVPVSATPPADPEDSAGGPDEGAEEGDFVAVPDIDEDLLEQLAPVTQALGEFYDEATPLWEASNEVIGILTPVLVEIAIALSPVMRILAPLGGGDLRAACENLGLVGTVFGVIQPAGLLPPVDLLSFLIPLFLLCGDVFDEVDEDAPALILDNVDLPV